MNDEKKSNGGAEGAPPSDTQHVQMEREVVEGMAQAIGAFVPPTMPRDALLSLAAQVIAEGAILGRALEDASYGHENATKHPQWAAVVLSQGEKVQIQGPKRIPIGGPRTTQQDIDQVLCSVTVLALLTSPIARAVLRAHGYDIAFGQRGAPKPNIIVAKG
jgi:hypothetical protein